MGSLVLAGTAVAFAGVEITDYSSSTAHCSNDGCDWKLLMVSIVCLAIGGGLSYLLNRGFDHHVKQLAEVRLQEERQQRELAEARLQEERQQCELAEARLQEERQQRQLAEARLQELEHRRDKITAMIECSLARSEAQSAALHRSEELQEAQQ